MYDIIVIGAGAAGLTSAIYAVRAGMNTVILEKLGVGGQIVLTEAVENYPGFPLISGPELMERFEEHVKKFNVEIRYEEVTGIKKEGKVQRVITSEGEYETIAIIVATGSMPRKLGVEGEEKFIGKGVSYCAVCDGLFFRDKEVAVIGGGDAAVKESIYLTQIVKKIYIIHRRDQLRAEKILQEQAFSNPKISFIWNHLVERINGNESFEGITIRSVLNPEEKRELKVSGVFVYIGHIPNTRFIDVSKTQNGQIITDECMRTSAEGIFAAGDCRNTCLRQIATCVGDGALAAYHAGEYVERIKSSTSG
ncbi:MAG: thioredoxin-disulfide reductase [Spirochaetota bacterium]